MRDQNPPLHPFIAVQVQAAAHDESARLIQQNVILDDLNSKID